MAYSSFGTYLQANFGSGYINIAEVSDIDGPGLQQAIASVTDQQASNRYGKSVSTLKDPGEIIFQLMFLPANATHTGLKDKLESGEITLFKMIFPNSTEWSFSAIVLLIEPGNQVDGAMTTDLTLRLTGNMSFSAGGFPYTFPYTLS